MTDREKIFEEIKKIYSEKKDVFISGKSKVQYAGSVYDEKEITAAVNTLLDGWLGFGKNGHAFEDKFADTIGKKHAIMVNSGSSANLVAISALSSKQLKNPIKPGDEAITTATTFPTTFNPILQNGLRPTVVDVELGTYNANIDQIEDAINEKTKLIILAHTLGNPLDMDRLTEIARDNDIYIIEDACDALGSKFNGNMCGSFGTFGTFSFYPAHHITTGEGGAIVTDDENLSRIAISIRDWGRGCFCRWNESNPLGACNARFGIDLDGIPYDHRYTYTNIGYNLKPIDLQAAMGLEQLKKLPDFTEKRKKNFRIFFEEFSCHEEFFMLPESHPKADPSWFSFPLTVKECAPFNRNDIVKFLEKNSIQTRVMFAGNILRHPAYKGIDIRVAENLKNSDIVMKNTFFIGIYPGIDEQRISYMLEKIREFIKAHT